MLSYVPPDDNGAIGCRRCTLQMLQSSSMPLYFSVCLTFLLVVSCMYALIFVEIADEGVKCLLQTLLSSAATFWIKPPRRAQSVHAANLPDA